MPPKRTSTSEAPAITQATIRKLVVDSIAAALEAQAATMANADNTNRNTRERKAPIARKLFSHSNYTEDCKVKFATGTLTEEALSWWNSFAQPIGIEEAYKITWVEFKKLLIKKFQELATLCPTMVLDSEKMMEIFIGGLPQSIEGNVIASKPQTLEETINIAQRLMDQNCRNKGPATGSNLLPVTVTCHACGEKGHYANQYRMTTNNNAQGRAYMLRDRNAHQDPNVYRAISWAFNDKSRLHVDPDKIEELRIGHSYYTLTEIRQFLGSFNRLVSEIYQDFLKDCKNALNLRHFQEGNDNFVVYCDASHQGLGAVLMQREKVIAYAS
ncbi:reverse transcriptase domain-containing protein [Tanacetum coccineum]